MHNRLFVEDDYGRLLRAGLWVGFALFVVFSICTVLSS
jgi:hypothetical protein